MPRYKYEREDGTTFTVRQPITEDPLEKCPDTGQEVERVITGGATVRFESDGFHCTDYDDSQNPAS